ncbi:MAG: hypothetical protein LC647_08200, partial [Beggiatoa sp.]|nr:hypothetical protein [Beggiatoa sp.]
MSTILVYIQQVLANVGATLEHDGSDVLQNVKQVGSALLHKSAAGRIPPEAGGRLEDRLRFGHAEPGHRVPRSDPR